MTRLLLAVNYINWTDILVGSPFDNVGYGHLQIVYENSNGELKETEVSSSWTVTAGNWDFDEFSQIHNDDDNTPNYGDSQYYKIVSIDLGEQSADAIWALLKQVRDQFAAAAANNPLLFEYDVDYNSNTYANTLLSIGGIDAASLISQFNVPSIGGIPGASNNALDYATYPNDAIDLTLNGSNLVDEIHTGNGDDKLYGHDGNDVLEGGAGADELWGGAGDDCYILGEDDGARDLILVGQGYDYVQGRGGAEDRLVLPTELLVAPSASISGPDLSHVGDGLVGTALQTSGISILGGYSYFWPNDDSGLEFDLVAQFVGNGADGHPGVVCHEGAGDDPDSCTPVVFMSDRIPLYDEYGYRYDNVDYDGNEYSTSHLTFDFRFYSLDLMMYSYSDVLSVYDGNNLSYWQDSLFIEVIYGPQESQYVLIEHFTPGDFGIQFHSLEGGGLGYTEESLAYINNNGEYTTFSDIPDAPAIVLDAPAPPPEAPINLDGGAGDDTLNGGNGDDTLRGRGGNDTLNGGHGSDSLIGGGGHDAADYRGSNAGVTVSLLSGTGIGGYAQGDVLVNIEDLFGSGYGDELLGNDRNNRLVGGGGNDRLIGGGGNDTLVGGYGRDFMDGGAGDRDAADYSDAANGVGVDLVFGGSFGEANGDTFSGVERLIGSAFNDALHGDEFANELSGKQGDDWLTGEGGDDTLRGGAGNDLIYGNEGDDQLFGGAGNDDLSGAAGDDTLEGGAGADIFDFTYFFGNDVVLDFSAGSAQSDVLRLTDSTGHMAFEDLEDELTYADYGDGNAGTLITLDVGTILLRGVLVEDLHANDFVFV